MHKTNKGNLKAECSVCMCYWNSSHLPLKR